MQRNHVNIRNELDGEIIRKINGINPHRSAYALACRLMEAGQFNVTVMPSNAQGKAGQVLTGRHNHGWYTGAGKNPVYLHTWPQISTALKTLL